MDDRSESRDEMEVSPKRNDNCQNTFQDESEESNRDTTTYGNQALLSVQQETLENQQLPSGISSETPLPSVPTPTSTSQTQNSDELDEIFSSKDVFYSSRKLRIRTKCSQDVDAVLTNRQHLAASIYHSRQSARNIAALGNRVLPSLGQETAESQQAPAGISSETCSRLSVPTISYSSPAQDFNLLDERFSNDDAFYSSRDLRIRTNCSRSLDALLSPRRNRLGRIDVRLSPQQNLTTSFRPIFEQSDVGDVTDRRDRSPLGECRDIKMASPPELFEVRITRSLSKKLNKKMSTPSPEKQSVEKGMGPTSAKKRRTESPEIDSGQCGAKNESFRSKISPSVVTRTRSKSPINVPTRETKATARESNVSETLKRKETPKKRKREIMESSCSDSNEALESNVSFPTLASETDLKSDLQTLESKEAVRKLGESESESATEGNSSIFSRGYSTDSDSATNHSTSDSQSAEEHKATLHSNIFPDISLCSPNRDSGKGSKRSSPSNRWIVVSPDSKESGSLKIKIIPVDEASSSNLEPSSTRISETEDLQSCVEVKADEFSSASSEAMQSTLDMAHLTTEIQMMESSQSGPITKNLDSPSRICDSGMEKQEFITCRSSRVFSNPPMSEQSSSEKCYIPYRSMALEAFGEKGGTDRDGSDSPSLVSEPNVKSGLKSKKLSISTSLGMLQRSASKNLSEMQDQDIPVQEHHRDPLQRQHSGSIPSEASSSREQTEVRMDIDGPYLDVHEGQPSTSSHQPVIADGSAGDRFSSPGVAASGEERGGVVESDSSAQRIPKYVSNAQKLLFTVLEEIMTFNEDENMYKRFSKNFRRIFKVSCQDTRTRLMLELWFYIEQRETGSQVQNLFRLATPECETKSVYEQLTRSVLITLCCTMSMCLNEDLTLVKICYERLKNLYESCLQVLRHDNEEIEDEDSGSRVAVLKEMIQRLLLQTRNAFRELLMHVGEHGESRFVDSFEEILWEEDRNFLRRRFLLV